MPFDPASGKVFRAQQTLASILCLSPLCFTIRCFLCYPFPYCALACFRFATLQGANLLPRVYGAIPVATAHILPLYPLVQFIGGGCLKYVDTEGAHRVLVPREFRGPVV